MNKLLLNGLALAVMAIIFASCQYKFIVEPAPIPPDPEDTVSFPLDVVPIWSDAGCTACHSTGGTAPDLTPDNAYGSITSMGLVNTETPEDSKIYFYPASDGNHYKKYNATQQLLILTWIQQGAKDNK